MDNTRIPSGELQVEVLRVLQVLGKGSTSDILHELKGKKPAYTTVNTVLDRLHTSGLVQRSRAPGPGGMKYVYSPATGANVRTKIITETLHSLVNAFGPSVVSAISEGLKELSEEQADSARSTKKPKK